MELPYESVIGKPFYKFIHPDSLDTFGKLFAKGLTGLSKGEINLISGQKIIPVYVSLTSIHPTLPNVGIIVTDLSEKKIQENILTENEEKFNALFQLSPFGISLADVETRHIVDVNEKYLKTFGYTCDEVIGKTNADLKLIDEAPRAKIIKEIQKFGKVKNIETEMRNKTGDIIPVLLSVETVTIGHKKYYLTAINDIGDRKKVQANLEQSEERYHRMVDEVQDYSIILLSKEGIIENWNKGAEKIKGYKAKEIIGKSFSVFYSAEDRANHIPEKLLAQAYITGKASDENWRVKKDGSRFWGSVVITALHDNEKNVIGYVKVTRDLTERKQADEEITKKTTQLEVKNMELEKMNKELESFAYISSHDLQEPLRKIQTFASRILEKEFTHLSNTGKDHFLRMQKAAQKMQTLIQDLLAYSRINATTNEFEPTDFRKIIEEVKDDFKERIKELHATIEVTGICQLSIIPFQFRQLMHNLIGNALKFSNPETPPHIVIKSEFAEGNTLNIPGLSKNQKYCHISIVDNGIGFENQYKEKIFDVFQRLHDKSEYDGTGIGLSIVKKIVETHGGIITAHSELNKGATFDIFIPVR
jgi:PAS domain S-box-containing protein